MGEDGLKRLLIIATEWQSKHAGAGKKKIPSLMHLLLLEIGFPPLVIYDAIRDGFGFEIIVFDGSCLGDDSDSPVFRADWPGIKAMIRHSWPHSLSTIIDRHFGILQTNPFAELQQVGVALDCTALSLV